jgi:hypothetical protein
MFHCINNNNNELDNNIRQQQPDIQEPQNPSGHPNPNNLIDMYVVWQDTTENSVADIFFLSGKLFSDIINLSNNDGGSTGPQIAIP